MSDTKPKTIKIYYDLFTNNISFLKVSKQLRELGVKNNRFFLKTYDKDLLDVDPFDSNLTKEMKAKIAYECKRNFWYFARRCVRVPVPGGTVPFELHIGNLTMLFLCMNNINNILILPRQNYKTGTISILFLWIFLFGASNSEILLFQKKFDGAQDNLARIMSARENIPEYLRLEVKQDIQNRVEAKCALRKNKITAKPSAKDKIYADQLGRGVTTPIINFDEWAFMLFNSIIYKAASPATSRAREFALNNKMPAFISITTTPGDLDTPHGEYAKQFFDRAYPFEYAMFDMEYKKLLEYVETKSKFNGFVYSEFSYKQIGRDEKYFEKQCIDLDQDMAKINREVLLMWQRGSDLSPFTKEELDLLTNNRKDPIYQLRMKDIYTFDVYSDFNWTDIVFLSCDMGGGCGTDNTVIQIIHRNTLEILAEFRSNMIDTDDAKELIRELMIMYLPKAIAFIERNTFGKNVIDSLMKDPIIGDRIYWEYKEIVAQKKIDDVKKTHMVNQKSKVRYYGISTDPKTRPMMVDLLRSIVKNEYKILKSKYIIDDISGLIRTKTGKIEHSASSHDDSVFAYLILRYAIAYGKNLAYFINKLTDVNISSSEITPSNLEALETLNIMDSEKNTTVMSSTAKVFTDFSNINKQNNTNLNFSEKMMNNIKLEEELRKQFETINGMKSKNESSDMLSRIFKMN